MTFPTDTLARESILSNVETVLSAIATPSYGTTVRRVSRWSGDDLKVTMPPEIIVVPGAESHVDTRLMIIEHTMPLALHLVVRGSNWATLLSKLIADVRVALLTDHTRGGKALTTRVLNDQIFDVGTTTDPVASAIVEVEIVYRTLTLDPTTVY